MQSKTKVQLTLPKLHKLMYKTTKKKDACFFFISHLYNTLLGPKGIFSTGDGGTCSPPFTNITLVWKNLLPDQFLLMSQADNQ